MRSVDVRADLIVPLDGVDTSALLEFWRWLVPNSLDPWFATALGDLFLISSQGEVWWLDVGGGELQVAAPNVGEFQRLAADPENAAWWFGTVLVERARTSGLTLAPGECYTYQQLPVLGGEYVPENFRAEDVVTHFRFWGSVHEQIRDLPDGTRVRFRVS